MLADVFAIAQWFFTFYFLGLHTCYLTLSIIAVSNIRRYMEEHSISNLPKIYTGLEIPISMLVPAYNEELTITDSLLSLLQINYPEFEIIAINDGSTDGTLDVLIENFDLIAFPEAYSHLLETKKIRGVYVSKKYPALRVIDKDNGGKADSLNAGINISRYPLFCAVDADSILQHNSLEQIAQPFIEQPETVAVGGSVRIANGCSIEKGYVTKANLPNHPLALFQVAEYLRAFLFGRLGWSPMNALLIISGAFGLFKKEAVVSVGGYRVDTIGEDMELIVRLHRKLREQRKPYRITFVPDPICWTEAPEDLKTLKNQRIRWQRGLSESLLSNLGLMFNTRGGVVGWVAMPYMLVFEWFGPILEFFGYIVVFTGFMTGYISADSALIFLVISIGFGMLLSVISVMLEELSFHIYASPTYVVKLFFAALLENFGYRQLNSIWRMMAMYQVIRGKKPQWGKMKRTANWSENKS